MRRILYSHDLGQYFDCCNMCEWARCVAVYVDKDEYNNLFSYGWERDHPAKRLYCSKIEVVIEDA